MKSKNYRSLIKPVLVVVIMAVTIFFFVRYFHAHPEYIDKLRHVDPVVVLWLLLANCALIVTVAAINHTSALMCRIRLGNIESLLLTIYSSLVNFFGPLQSGPGVRAVYLKTRYKVWLRDFTFITLIAYGVYACVSALFLAVGALAWWQTVLVVLAAGGCSALVLTLFKRRGKQNKMLARLHLSPRLLAVLIIATVLQVVFTAVRYGIALHAVGAHVTLGQIVSYTGAANFALFVSLTPDGIGIREAFLLFSQRLHGVSTHDIVAASLVDRASYVVFLALLGIVALTLHVGKRFSTKNNPKEAEAGEQPPTGPASS